MARTAWEKKKSFCLCSAILATLRSPRPLCSAVLFRMSGCASCSTHFSFSFRLGHCTVARLRFTAEPGCASFSLWNSACFTDLGLVKLLRLSRLRHFGSTAQWPLQLFCFVLLWHLSSRFCTPDLHAISGHIIPQSMDALAHEFDLAACSHPSSIFHRSFLLANSSLICFNLLLN